MSSCPFVTSQFLPLEHGPSEAIDTRTTRRAATTHESRSQRRLRRAGRHLERQCGDAAIDSPKPVKSFLQRRPLRVTESWRHRPPEPRASSMFEDSVRTGFPPASCSQPGPGWRAHTARPPRSKKLAKAWKTGSFRPREARSAARICHTRKGRRMAGVNEVPARHTTGRPARMTAARGFLRLCDWGQTGVRLSPEGRTMEPGPSRDRISDLYHRALACTPEERRAFLQDSVRWR